MALLRELLSLWADPETQARMDDLADRCTEGQLNPLEHAEYEAHVAVSGVIAILQAKARLALATPAA